MWNGLIGGANDLVDVFVLHLLGGPREEGMQIFPGLWSNTYWQWCDAVCVVVHRKVLPPVVLAWCERLWTDALSWRVRHLMRCERRWGAWMLRKTA